MLLQFCSDLHLEDGDLGAELPVSAPYLALLGDIAPIRHPRLAPFLRRCSSRYKGVLFVAGNHEYYPTELSIATMSTLRSELTALCNELDNVHFLDNSAVVLDGVRFLGTTLWSNVPEAAEQEVERAMPDYSSIRTEVNRYLSVKETNELHDQAVAWLRRELSNNDDDIEQQQPTVVLTHHAPLVKHTSDPKYETLENAMRYAFATDMMFLMRAPVKAWLFGHTHWRTDLLLANDIRVCSNPLGYENEDKNHFEPDCVIDIQ